MSVISTAHGLVVQYGARTVLQDVSLAVQDGDRLAIVGANGSGKSTLLKILAGQLTPDQGECIHRSTIRMSYVGQEDEIVDREQTVESLLNLKASQVYSTDEEVSGQIGFWRRRLNLDSGNELLVNLSGGQKKKAFLASALVSQPDLLIMDEPTNHLDIESILDLEQILLGLKIAIIFVSHDRWFIERLSTKVVELGAHYPNGLLEVSGSYSKFLEERSLYWQQAQRQQEVLENQVRREVEWLRRGPQARLTKSKARQEKALEMVADLEKSKEQLSRSKIDFDFASTQGKRKLVSARGLQMEYNGQVLFDHLDVDVFKGQRLAVLGPNGCGKTTLLKVLSGLLRPVQGEVVLNQEIQVRYFDQNKEQLDGHKSVQQILSGEGDFVQVQGKTMHVVAYAKKFLFRPEQMNLPVHQLSGGERVRLILARFMTESADLFILDEPTNDLDLESVQALEMALNEFPGGIIFVSHDRFFLESLADKFLALEDSGTTTFYASLDQWLNQLKHRRGQIKQKLRKEKVKENESASKPIRRLSYQEKREWEQMERRISEAEEALEHWRAELENPKTLINSIRLKEAFEEMSRAQGLVDQLYERWAELERIQGGS